MRVCMKKNPSGKCIVRIGDWEGNIDGLIRNSSFRDNPIRRLATKHKKKGGPGLLG